MRFRYNGRYSAANQAMGKGSRRHHGTLNVQVNIDQARNHVSSPRIDHFVCLNQFRTAGSDIHESAVKYSDVIQFKPFIITVIHIYIHNQLICTHGA
ncbi:hypothetical protein D3C76_1515070 [compost metagenome]